jgi:hypothetical protein
LRQPLDGQRRIPPLVRQGSISSQRPDLFNGSEKKRGR